MYTITYIQGRELFSMVGLTKTQCSSAWQIVMAKVVNLSLDNDHEPEQEISVR